MHRKYLLPLALAAMLLSGAANALDAPTISATATSGGNVQVRINQTGTVTGFNLYIDNNYVETRRVQAGQNTVLFSGAVGSYCVASFNDRASVTQYSSCSNHVAISAADLAGSSGNLESPINFTYQLYSKTAAELFWSPPTSASVGIRYELKRDNQLLASTDGRSYFEAALEQGSLYSYELIAIDIAGRRSEPVKLTLDTGSDNPPATGISGDNQSPTIPGNLRGTYYSATAAELFWERSSDNEGVAHYEIKRNGQTLATLDAQSYFEASLNQNNRYEYEIVAIDFSGNRSSPATLVLSNDAAAPSSDQLDIVLNATRVSLQEGSEQWLSIPLSIKRVPGNTRAVNFSLRAENQLDNYNFTYQFDPSNLGGDVSGSNLFVKLGVGIAPIDFHERRFILSADDGQSSTEITLIFDVIPVKAPDVYLLIGQSNMEGSSELFAKATNAGEPDELNARIRQLNVQSNSTSVFTEPWQFTDEFSNVGSPRYIVAEDPLHEPRAPGQPRKEARFIGLGLSFAKAALANTTQEIYLVPAAWSATGFCVSIADELGWNAEPTPEPYLSGTLLADRALTRLNMTLRETRGVFRGILWHQGEADSNNYDCAVRYEQNLRKLINRIRTQAFVDQRGLGARGPNAAIPLVVGTMSKGNDDRGTFSDFGFVKNIVDEVHRNIDSKIGFSASSNHDDLVPPAYPCGQGSCIHFGSSAYREIGSRYHDALRRIIDR